MTRRLSTRKWTALCMGMAAVAMTTMMTGCSDDYLASNANANGVNSTEMNVDELKVKVTADVPTAVVSSFDDNSMGGALVRRLSKTTNEVTDDTKMILIKGEDIMNRPFTEWMHAAKIYLRGGYIAVEKPHDAHLVKMMEELANKMAQAEEELLLKDGISIVRTARNKTAAQSSHVSRLNTRIANIATRAGESDDNEPVAELVIFARNGYYHHAPYQGKKYTSEIVQADGTVTTNTVEHNPDYSNFVSGLMADGAAAWLNKRGSVSTKSASGTRADGEQAINDIMGADDEWTYIGPLNAVNMDYSPARSLKFVSKPNAQQEIIRIWASHDMEANKDFYLVQHSSTSALGGRKDGDERFDPNKTLYRGPYEEDKWEERRTEADDYVDERAFYGDWYDNSEFSFNVTGEGSVMVEGAVPSTDRSEISTTVTVGKFDGQMTTIGGTGSVSTSGGGVTGTVNRGWVKGTFYSLSTTTTVEELACEKNTDGSKVSWWYHESKDMSAGDKDEHPVIGDGLINDVDVSNQVCWSVSNPSGQHTLEMSHQVKLGNICHENFYVKNNLEGAYDGKYITLSNAIPDNRVNVKYQLPVPNRSIQKWNMDVTFPELNQDGYSEVKTKLTEALQNQFPSVYQPEIILADQTDASETTIGETVGESSNLLKDGNGLQTLREYAQTYKLSEFTIKWYCAGTDHNTYQFTVKADGDPEGKDITIDPVDLSTLTKDFLASDGDILTGTLAGNYKITVAPGSTITLNGVTINNIDDQQYDWAGITLMGDATIVLADGSTNVVKGFNSWQPAIFVPGGKKLVIQGNTGTLDATNKGQGPGIGGNNSNNCGSIEIQGGVITAKGGANGAGIGSALKRGCGDIVISGGTITATGGYGAAGIGSGRSKDGVTASCGNITISGGTVVATHGDKGAAIGSGLESKCGNITINATVTSVTATGAIGAGQNGMCGTVTIEEGANVIKQ